MIAHMPCVVCQLAEHLKGISRGSRQYRRVISTEVWEAMLNKMHKGRNLHNKTGNKAKTDLP